MIYNFNDIHFSYPLDVVRRRMQLAGAVTDGYKYRYCLLEFFQFVHSVLSLKAGARGFPPACMCMNPGYFHRKKQENRPRKLNFLAVQFLAYQLHIFGNLKSQGKSCSIVFGDKLFNCSADSQLCPLWCKTTFCSQIKKSELSSHFLLSSLVCFAIHEQLQTGGNRQMNEGVGCKRNCGSPKLAAFCSEKKLKQSFIHQFSIVFMATYKLDPLS